MEDQILASAVWSPQLISQKEFMFLEEKQKPSLKKEKSICWSLGRNPLFIEEWKA